MKKIALALLLAATTLFATGTTRKLNAESFNGGRFTGELACTQDGPWSIEVSNFPATTPVSLTGTLPVSLASIPLPSGAAIAANQTTANSSLSSIDSKLTSPLSVSVSSLPLPTGAATESTLSTLSGKIPSSLTVSSARLLVDGSGVTQPVSIGSLPLPSGGATSANQSTEITSLQLIDDAVNASDTALSKGVPIMAQYDDISPGTVTENNISAVRMNSKRDLSVGVASRISEMRVRTHFQAVVENVTSTTTIRTVTAGKTAYVTNFTISAFNTATGVTGRVVIRDSSTNVIPFVIPSAILTLVAPLLNINQTTEGEPLVFSTNISLAILAGTVTASASVSGYEE